MLFSFTLSKFLTNRIRLLYKLQKRDISDINYGSLLALYSNVVYKVKIRRRTLEPILENFKSILLEARSFSPTEQEFPVSTNMEDSGKRNGVCLVIMSSRSGIFCSWVNQTNSK